MRIKTFLSAEEWDYLSVCKLRLNYKGYGFCKDCIYFDKCNSMMNRIVDHLARRFYEHDYPIPNSLREMEDIVNCSDLMVYFWENIISFKKFRSVLLSMYDI